MQSYLMNFIDTTVYIKQNIEKSAPIFQKKKLKSVKIIQSKEFQNSNVTTINIPSSVKIIGSRAFNNSKSHETINFDNPSTVMRIE